MKQFLITTFFCFIAIIAFLWNQELNYFWMEPGIRGSLNSEYLIWYTNNQEFIQIIDSYKYIAISVVLIAFLIAFFRKIRKKRIARVKNTFAPSKKVILDGDAILSRASLPESEKEREKQMREGPALIQIDKKGEAIQSIPESGPDFDITTMREMLGTK